MRNFAWLVFAVGGVLGFYALSMDTTVSSGGLFGRVNNLGLMNDKQNYLMIAGAAFIGGLLILLLGRTDSAPSSNSAAVSKPIDPFDEVDAERINERKRYAIRLGVTRRDGQYIFDGVPYAELESAIQIAEAYQRERDPAEHFLG